MKKINLTQGKYALVDNEDFEYLNQFRWHFSNYYAARKITKDNGKYTSIYMHRIINNTPEGMDTDHINGDKLDNRKCNLRSCTNSQNHMNRGCQSNNASGYKGVDWKKAAQKWRASIKSDGKRRHLGYYDTAEAAHAAYKREAKISFKEFCNIN